MRKKDGARNILCPAGPLVWFLSAHTVLATTYEVITQKLNIKLTNDLGFLLGNSNYKFTHFY